MPIKAQKIILKVLGNEKLVGSSWGDALMLLRWALFCPCNQPPSCFQNKSFSGQYTVIHFVRVCAKFSTCTVVGVNETLVEVNLCTITLESTHFIFNKCPIYTHDDGASAKFSTISQETDYSVLCILYIQRGSCRVTEKPFPIPSYNFSFQFYCTTCVEYFSVGLQK